MRIEITNEDIAKASNENLATLFSAIVSMARANKPATPAKSAEPDPVEPADNEVPQEEPQVEVQVESDEPVKAEEPKVEPDKTKKRQTRKAKQETPVKVEEPKEAPKVEAEPEVEVEPADEITVPEETKTITKDELRKYLMKLQENGETSKIAVAFKECGVKKFSEIAEDQYQRVYDLVRA